MPSSFADGSQDTSTHSHKTTFTAGTPPDERIASLICTGVSISLPAFRWILMCDLIVVAFRSPAALPPCRSEKSRGYRRPRIIAHTIVKPQWHHSEAAVITPSIVLTTINCLQLRHDYIGHYYYRAAVLRSRVENMGKGKHFELTTMSSRGNSQVPWNAPFSKPIDQCNPGTMFWRFPVPQKWMDAGSVKDCVTASMSHSRLFFHCFSRRNPPSWDLKSVRNSKAKKSEGKPN